MTVNCSRASRANNFCNIRNNGRLTPPSRGVPVSKTKQPRGETITVVTAVFLTLSLLSTIVHSSPLYHTYPDNSIWVGEGTLRELQAVARRVVWRKTVNRKTSFRVRKQTMGRRCRRYARWSRLLLLISGVEPNPGPMCPSCSTFIPRDEICRLCESPRERVMTHSQPTVQRTRGAPGGREEASSNGCMQQHESLETRATVVLSSTDRPTSTQQTIIAHSSSNGCMRQRESTGTRATVVLSSTDRPTSTQQTIIAHSQPANHRTTVMMDRTSEEARIANQRRSEYLHQIRADQRTTVVLGGRASAEQTAELYAAMEAEVHAETTGAEVLTYQCPYCEYAPAARYGPAMTSHVNTVHPPERRPPTSADRITAAKLYICSTCNEAVAASNHGRNAHVNKCGMFRSRNTRIAENERRRTTQPNNNPPEAALVERRHDRAGITDKSRADITDDIFFGTRPRSRRYLKRGSWNTFVGDVLRHSLRGYTNDSVEGRMRRQRSFVQLIRQTLSIDGPDKKKTGDTSPTRDATTARIEALVEVGALSRAVRAMMTGTKPQQITDEVLQRLQDLHPQSEPVDGTDFLEHHILQGIEEVEIQNLVRRRLAKGAAPGLDGWTRELLLPIIHNKESLCEFSAMIADIANGVVSNEVKMRLMASPLFALEKGDGGTRPIAVESVIVKLISHLALSRVAKTAWKTAFPAHQFGVGPDANVESAVHMLRERIERTQHGVLVDCTNAYNTVSRTAILARLRAHPEFWPIFRIASWSLASTPLCVISDGKTVSRLNSTSGVRQGSVLGPVLFSLAVQPVLNRINTTCSAECAAYLDDITITSASPRDAATAFAVAQTELAKIGLKVNVNKTTVLAEGPLVIDGVQQTNRLAKLLGAGITLPTSETALADTIGFVNKQIGKHDTFFESLEKTELRLATKMALLKICGIGRPTFIMRTHPAAATSDAALHFDSNLERLLRHVVGVDAQLADIALLPERMGGLGLRGATDVADIAYHARQRGDQRTQTEEFERLHLHSVRTTLTDRERDVMESYSRVPLQNITCSDDAFRMVCRDRLQLPIAHADAVCPCGKPLDTAHIHTCVSNSARWIGRHDAIVALVNRYAQRRFATRVEPSRLLKTSRARPDLAVHAPSGDILIDVSVTYVGRANALKTRADEKRAKYSALANFFPFVIGHTGELEDSAEALLKVVIPFKAERDEFRVGLRSLLYDQNFLMYSALLRK